MHERVKKIYSKGLICPSYFDEIKLEKLFSRLLVGAVIAHQFKYKVAQIKTKQGLPECTRSVTRSYSNRCFEQTEKFSKIQYSWNQHDHIIILMCSRSHFMSLRYVFLFYRPSDTNVLRESITSLKIIFIKNSDIWKFHKNSKLFFHGFDQESIAAKSSRQWMYWDFR